MAKKRRKKDNPKRRAKELTPEELEGQRGEPLPDREVLSILPVTDPHSPAVIPQLEEPIPVPEE